MVRRRSSSSSSSSSSLMVGRYRSGRWWPWPWPTSNNNNNDDDDDAARRHQLSVSLPPSLPHSQKTTQCHFRIHIPPTFTPTIKPQCTILKQDLCVHCKGIPHHTEYRLWIQCTAIIHYANVFTNRTPSFYSLRVCVCVAGWLAGWLPALSE